MVKIGGSYFDALTGAALEKRLTLWSGPFVGRGSGFLSVNDGVTFAEQLLAALEERPLRPKAGRDNLHGARVVDVQVDELLARRKAATDAYNEAIRRHRDAA